MLKVWILTYISLSYLPVSEKILSSEFDNSQLPQKKNWTIVSFFWMGIFDDPALGVG